VQTAAMGQIPRSTERILVLYMVVVSDVTVLCFHVTLSLLC